MSGKKVVIIGGGAAGCMAAVFAARQGAEVIVLESTPRLMNKVRITGKGRCNVTNAVRRAVVLCARGAQPAVFEKRVYRV